ncbi:VOC family protein [Maribacter algicola]|uniref:VOC family protein n=1 Tax=Meishania litoralis TaxID=3434685 RepID=A0ACC7LL81_9FLAO
MKKVKIINGIQQVGIGVKDAKQVFNWYRKNLGFDILVFEDVATASLMTRYTDGVAHERYAILALNMVGGGGLEIWEYRSRVSEPSKTSLLLGDLGINVLKIRSHSIDKVYAKLQEQGINHLSKNGKSHFFFSDSWGNLVQVVKDDYCFTATKSCSGGVSGSIIGVSDMRKALRFYQGFLGYETLISDQTGVFADFERLPGGGNQFRRVLLKHPARQIGGFGELYGPSQIELLQVLDRTPHKIYKDRLWGDLGYIHLCFDVNGMNVLRQEAKSLGYEFTVDSADSFDMGEAAGRFAYVEDPDGTLIEFVETHKVPIHKKLGLYINLKNRNPFKPLPKILVKALKFHRRTKDL